MTEQEEVVAALEDERRLSFRPLRFRLKHVQFQAGIFKCIVDPENDRSSLDESLEGLAARWTTPQPGHANILSVVPEDSLLNLRFLTGAPPTQGELIWIQVPDFLGQLLLLWQNDGIAADCLRWVQDIQHANEPTHARDTGDDGFPWLRPRQRESFKLCAWRRGFLWGPPGTGKTTSLGCMLAQYLVQFPYDHILLLSATNTAVDQALVAVDRGLDHLRDRGVSVSDARQECKRIGLHFVPSHYEGREHLLPVIDPELIRRLTELEAVRPDPGDDQAYALCRDAAKSLRQEIRDRARQDLLDARLAAMTTTRATFDFELLSTLGYDLVVFDEASQVGLAHALMLARLGSRLLFVGDHKQLAPVVQSDLPVAVRWLGASMFSYMPVSHPSTCVLDEQDRMAEPICRVVSRVFYDDKLRVATDAAANPAWRAAREVVDAPALGQEHIFIRRIEQEGTHASPGWYRLLSMEFICQAIHGLVSSVPEEDILVVTPFRAQRHRIRRRLRELGLRRVSVTTVHRAQGSERHTVFFDPVRGSSQFLMSEDGCRIINVAISRAKARLVLTLSRGDRQNPILDLIQMLAHAN